MKLFVLPLLLAALVPQDEKSIKDKQAEVMAFVKTAKTEQALRAATSDLVKLAEEAFGINKYELSAKLYGDAEKLARTALKDAAFGQQLQESAKRAADVGKEYTKAAKGVERILRNEGTPEDYTLSGKFLCFVKGDWELGLADLSKGKDEALKKLAEDDIAAGNPAALGDAWFAMMKKEPAAKERALHWYAQAWPKLAGIDREKLRERVNKLSVPAVPGKPGPMPAGWGGTVDLARTNADISPIRAHSGGRALRIPGYAKGGTGSVLRVGMPLPPGKKVEFTAWACTDGTDSISDSLTFMIDDAAGKVLVRKPYAMLADTPIWSKLFSESEIPAGAVLFRIEFVMGSTKGAVWLDDISVRVDGMEILKGGSFEP